MNDITLTSNNSDKLDIKKIKIRDISHIDDYLYIVFDNEQKVLANQEKTYDLSDFGYVEKILKMGDRLCAVVSNGFHPCLLDLDSKEVLFDDKEAYSISKEDDRTLHVIKKIGGGNNIIYDIERKCYLPMPDDYEYENSLGNGLYVFSESNNEIPFYDRKRCVIHVSGNVVLNNIKGWIYLEDNYLVIHKDDALLILELDDENKVKSVKKIEKNEIILATPEYYEGKIIVVLKDKINVYKPNLELINSIPVEGLSFVNDSERIGDVLKLAVPTMYKGEENGKHIFVNVKTGKKIEHLRISGYPYWTQDSFVGQDDLDMSGNNSTPMDFYFYDKDFNFILKEKGTSYYSADDENESLFIVENEGRKKLINTENGSVKETDYISVKYHFSAPYGYGIHKDCKTMDFFDNELNVIIPNFEFEKYNMNFNQGGFGYFIVNGYVCITTDFVDGYGRSRYRRIIYSSDGEVILDSLNCKCFPIGNFIQIMNGKESQFLNTMTGEIGELCINAPVDEMGKIDMTRIDNFRNNLIISDELKMINDSDNKKDVKRLIFDGK